MKGLAWGVAVAIGMVVSPSYGAPPPAKPAAPLAAKPKSLGETLTGQAKTDYESARVLVGDGDYAGALIKFQSAYDGSKDPRLLFNVAASEKQLRHYARAVDLLKKYAADTGPLVTAKDKEEAAEFIKTLEPFTVAVTLDVTEPDATVEIDDAVVGKSPLPGPIVVDIGQRKIRARKEGYRDFVTTVTLGGSATQTVPMKLEKEVHEGKLSIQVPPGASITIDGQPIAPGAGKEPVETRLLSGGHTLRVTAPGMRAYEREVIVRDNELRVVEVQLEREAELERPTLRVSIGCVDTTPRNIDDGLALYIDDSPAAATASGGKKRWNAELGRDEVDYVAFPVSTGTHKVQVRIPGCRPAETTFTVNASGGELRGALPSASPGFVRGPAGNPDWGRIGVALWLPGTIGKGFEKGLTFSPESQAPLSGLKYSPSGVGVAVQPAITFRWLTMMLDFGYASGTASIGSAPAVTAPEVLAAIEGPSVSWLRAGVRAGARFPLNVGAFHLGVGTGYDNISLTNLAPGLGWDRDHWVYGTAWAMLDIHVLCDLALFAGFHIDVHNEADTATYGLQFGAAFQPNKICRAERGTAYELTSRPGGGAP